jgi:hypothetical protein
MISDLKADTIEWQSERRDRRSKGNSLPTSHKANDTHLRKITNFREPTNSVRRTAHLVFQVLDLKAGQRLRIVCNLQRLPLACNLQRIINYPEKIDIRLTKVRSRVRVI